MSLDPKTNRATRELEKAAEANEVEPLEPPFPFRRQTFDPFFFGVEKEPAPEPLAL